MSEVASTGGAVGFVISLMVITIFLVCIVIGVLTFATLYTNFSLAQSELKTLELLMGVIDDDELAKQNLSIDSQRGNNAQEPVKEQITEQTELT